MTSYIYPHPRRLSLPLFSLFFALLLSASAQIADSASDGYFSSVVTEADASERAAEMGYKLRLHTLQHEGFERFSVLTDRQGNALVEYALSGRFAYLHIRANEKTSGKVLGRAISDAFAIFGDAEGIILDLRYNELDEASQNNWLQYILKEKFLGPGVLISSRSFSLPHTWHLYTPWQYLPDADKTNDDGVIHAALRKLRLPNPQVDFGAIWGK